MSDALEMTKNHANWKKCKPFTLQEAASRAIQAQTVKDFRYLKAIDEAHAALEKTVSLDKIAAMLVEAEKSASDPNLDDEVDSAYYNGKITAFRGLMGKPLEGDSSAKGAKD